MPPLSETLGTNMKGFEPAPSLSLTPQSVPGTGGFRPNPVIRCPLPPINATVDNLRQFNDADGNVPRRRVLPLPVNNTAGGGTIVNNFASSASSSSGSSTTPTTLTAKTVVFTSPILSPGASSSQTVVMAKSFQLISASANVPCEFRLYGNAGSQAVDAARPMDAPPPAELFNNIIADVVLDTTPLTWSFQSIVGVNTDSPQDTHTFVTAFNIGENPAQIQISFTFLPLES